MVLRCARMLASVALVTVVVPTWLSGSVASAAVTAACSSFTEDLHQRSKPSTDASLVTRFASEADRAAERYGFTDDLGVLARAAGTDGEGLVAVYRLYKAGDFAWASTGAELDALVASGYVKQHVEFYAGESDAACLDPLYRLVREGKHRLAAAAERDDLIRDGWELEPTVFYVSLPADVAPPAPPGGGGAGDTEFSLAVIPDTQTEVVIPTDRRFRNRATWLAENKSELDLRYALQVGDLVNWGDVAPEQYTKASEEIKPLEAAVPWAGALGNHDTGAVCAGGSACPGEKTWETVRETYGYNKAFPVSRFPNMRGTFEAGKVDNAYATFSAGGVDWLVLTLELWPRPAAVTWARSVVADHPSHNVIVVTHAYLNGDGSIGQDRGGYGATSPQYLYDNLIKLYPNVKLVFSGHVGESAMRTDTGNAGNKIVSLLQTFHSRTTNPVRLVEIDTANGTVTSRVYAPYTGESFSGASTSASGLSFAR